MFIRTNSPVFAQQMSKMRAKLVANLRAKIAASKLVRF